MQTFEELVVMPVQRSLKVLISTISSIAKRTLEPDPMNRQANRPVSLIKAIIPAPTCMQRAVK